MAPPTIYPVEVRPSINGYRQNGRLWWNEPAVELTEFDLTRTITWPRFTAPVLVVDSLEVEVPTAEFDITSVGFFPSGATLDLPVTELSGAEPPYSGPLSQGYATAFRFLPTAALSPRDTFELASNGTFTPAFVTVENAPHGLRLDLGPPQIQQVLPSSGGNGADAQFVTVTITGRKLLSGATVKLSRIAQLDIPGTQITPGAYGFSLTATFDLRNAAGGLWDVMVMARRSAPVSPRAG